MSHGLEYPFPGIEYSWDAHVMSQHIASLRLTSTVFHIIPLIMGKMMLVRLETATHGPSDRISHGISHGIPLGLEISHGCPLRYPMGSRYRGNFSTLSPDKEKRIQIYYIYVYIEISRIHIYTYI
jgi:hypothetical protein